MSIKKRSGFGWFQLDFERLRLAEVKKNLQKKRAMGQWTRMRTMNAARNQRGKRDKKASAQKKGEMNGLTTHQVDVPIDAWMSKAVVDLDEPLDGLRDRRTYEKTDPRTIRHNQTRKRPSEADRDTDIDTTRCQCNRRTNKRTPISMPISSPFVM